MNSKLNRTLVVASSTERVATVCDWLRDADIPTVLSKVGWTGAAKSVIDDDPQALLLIVEDDDSESLDAALDLVGAVAKPAAMFVSQANQDQMQQAVEAGVAAFIVDGLSAGRVKPVLELAVARFEVNTRRDDEITRLRTGLEDRKLVERAKGILMDTRGISEAEAYKELRTVAMKRSSKIVDVASALIASADLLRP